MGACAYDLCRDLKKMPPRAGGVPGRGGQRPLAFTLSRGEHLGRAARGVIFEGIPDGVCRHSRISSCSRRGQLRRGDLR
jgi:hypothetical protein